MICRYGRKRGIGLYYDLVPKTSFNPFRSSQCFKTIPRILPEGVQCNNARLEEGDQFRPMFFIHDRNIRQLFGYAAHNLAIDGNVPLPVPLLFKRGMQDIPELKELLKIQFLDTGIGVFNRNADDCRFPACIHSKVQIFDFRMVVYPIDPGAFSRKYRTHIFAKSRPEFLPDPRCLFRCEHRAIYKQRIKSPDRMIM
jgi:hypothetical protein